MATVPNCPFCIENGKLDIVETMPGAYLARVKDPAGKVVPKRYFINPYGHVTSIFDLQEDYWAAVKKLRRLIPEIVAGAHFNMSMNCGENAGQRLEHVHLWVVIRDEPKGTPSRGLGLSKLIDVVNELSRELAARDAEMAILRRSLSRWKIAAAVLALIAAISIAL